MTTKTDESAEWAPGTRIRALINFRRGLDARVSGKPVDTSEPTWAEAERAAKILDDAGRG